MGRSTGETSDVTNLHTFDRMNIHVFFLGHSLYDLGQEAGNEVFYALTCSY